MPSAAGRRAGGVARRMSPMSRGPSNSAPATRAKASSIAPTPKLTRSTNDPSDAPADSTRVGSEAMASVSLSERSALRTRPPTSGSCSNESTVSGSCCSRFADSVTSCGAATARKAPSRTATALSTITVAQPRPTFRRRPTATTTGSSAIARNSDTTMRVNTVEDDRTVPHSTTSAATEIAVTTTVCQARSTRRLRAAGAAGRRTGLLVVGIPFSGHRRSLGSPTAPTVEHPTEDTRPCRASPTLLRPRCT